MNQMDRDEKQDWIKIDSVFIILI